MDAAHPLRCHRAWESGEHRAGPTWDPESGQGKGTRTKRQKRSRSLISVLMRTRRVTEVVTYIVMLGCFEKTIEFIQVWCSHCDKSFCCCLYRGRIKCTLFVVISTSLVEKKHENFVSQCGKFRVSRLTEWP